MVSFFGKLLFKEIN